MAGYIGTKSVSLSTDAATISGDLTIGGNLSLGDNDKAIFGAGSDLEIYHDGSNSYIKDVGTGSLRIKSSAEFYVQDASDDEIQISAFKDGEVALWYNGSKKLGTSASGISVTGTVTADGLTMGDGHTFALGDASEFTIVHTAGGNTNIGEGGSGNLNISARDLLIQDVAGTSRLKVDGNLGDISFYEDTGTTAKLFWDASAEALGIGTLAPDQKLHITDGTSSGAVLRLERSDTSMGNNDVYGGIEFEGNDTDTNANGIRGFIRGLGQGTGGGMKMEFGTAGGGAAIGSARMTLDADGNVKIGPDAQDIQLLPASTNSGVNTVYLRGNASNDKATVTLNHYGVRAFDISAGVIGSGLFHIGNGASDPAFVIDGSSNVGIGNSNPSDYYAGAANLVIGSNNGTDNGITIVTPTNKLGRIHFADGTTGSAEYAGFIAYDHATDELKFGAGANGAIDLTIDSSGNVLVGKASKTDTPTSGGAYIHGNTNAGSTNYYAQFFVEHNSTNNHGIVIKELNAASGIAVAFLKSDGGLVGSINTTTSSTTYATSSDYRLKTDAQPMTGASARVQALNPVNFEWIVDGTRTDGFLAHEAQAIVPEAVTGTKDAMMDQEYEVTPAVLDENGTTTTEAVIGTRSVPDYQGIDQSKIVPLLTAALREALTKIDDMETRLAALEDV